MHQRLPSAFVALVALVTAACAGAPAAPAPAPVPIRVESAAPPPTAAPAPRPGLPPFPKVAGTLIPDMVYPPEGYVMSVRESTFVFGNVGNGDATLTINGAPVTVNPNGSFMAFLPVPRDTAYTLRASLPNGDTATAVRKIRFPERGAPPRPAAVFDTAGFPRALTLTNTNEYATSDTDMVTYARPVAGGTYKYFLMPGTVVQATARLGSSVRVRLDSQLDAWVEAPGTSPAITNAAPNDTAARLAAAESALRPRRITAARIALGAGYTDIVLTMESKAPFAVDQSGDRLSLTVYGARANLDYVRFDTNDPTVRLVRWEQVTNERVRFDVDLRHQSVGYLVLWRAGALVLRVRHAPVVDQSAPLRGRVIAVDAGHPPGGAMGPTRLREAEATLPIAQQLKELLEARGARVIMLRSDANAVALGARPIQARRENAEAFVSIHLNAFADGANPFAVARGSGTFFFHPQSEPLARAVQQGLARHMGLRDEGIFFFNLAVARPTWFPSVLCEGAWIVMPEQEAALRNPEFQRAYALGVVEGLERYFRELR
ncbi:MAG: N-acetylmuramoyl-L-alanine amidase [Gemmatimonadetes bacterium]|nr:N-acetylmuramoyl-L-alanine amidase [Gemmatimonadota bacterium]